MKKNINKIKKRDGRIVDFDLSKIANAIFKATEAVGSPDFDFANALALKVVEILKKELSPKEIPTVEKVQDVVEQALIEAGRARVAKAYILYRRKRTEIREEKKRILNKEEIDEVDKMFDINALKVLASRYLKKDEDGNIIESPKELFERVSIHVTLPSILFDKRVSRKKGNVVHKEEGFNADKFEGKIKIGRYTLNKFHLEALKRMYDRFNKKKQMKIRWSDLLEKIEKGEFNHYEKEVEQYYLIMVQRKFLPNTPALVNFGRELGMGSACFVLDIEDSIESIMDTLGRAAIIFKSGGGVGYNFSKLRPNGDFVKSTGGVASGPISFMSLYDKMTDVVKQGGVRRGANMGILNSNHPDIEDFIKAKEGNAALQNFNISCLIKSDFWEYFEKDRPYPLINPRNNEIVKYISPRQLFQHIAYQAWESAEPGVVFEDRVNQYNPFLETLGPIQATNPCGEVLLYPNESCNLGSINLWAFVKEKNKEIKDPVVEFDWDDFKKTIQIATRFLDNVVEVNLYPLPEIEEMTLSTRKIGLGVMGLGDVLYELEIPYDSQDGFDFMDEAMEFLNFYSKETSILLAKDRGRFPYFNKSFYPKGKLPFSGIEDRKSRLPGFGYKWQKEILDWSKLKKEIKKYGLRNAFTTVIAPTGSISMIAGCSSGIEPVFSLIFEKKVAVGSFYYVDPVFEKKMTREGLFDEELIKEVADKDGSVQNISYIPANFKKIFKVAGDIKFENHIRALAAFQKWTDSSISKTINFLPNTTVEDIEKAYILAHDLGCKDITVFRMGSIKGVLSVKKEVKKPKNKNIKKEIEKLVPLKDVKAKGPSIYHEPGAFENGEINICPNCESQLVFEEGCKKCPNCGWGLCSSS